MLREDIEELHCEEPENVTDAPSTSMYSANKTQGEQMLNLQSSLNHFIKTSHKTSLRKLSKLSSTFPTLKNSDIKFSTINITAIASITFYRKEI